MGNGRNIHVWRDSKIPRYTYHKTLTSKPSRRIQRVVNLLDQTRAWKEDLVRNNFDPTDADAILCIRTCGRLHEDIMAWNLKSYSIFLVYNACNLALGKTPAYSSFSATSSRSMGDNLVCEKTWSADVPSKVNFFLLGRLQTIHLLLRRIS
jgi:hypothetical protein